MPDVELAQLRQRRHRPDVVEGEPVARVHLEAQPFREGRHIRQPGKLPRPALHVARQVRLAIGPGVQLDHRRADPPRRLDLPAVGGDEDRDPAARLPQRRDEMRQPVLVLRHLEPALGGALLPPLRHDADRVRPVAERDRLHLVRGRHLEVQRQRQLRHQRRDIGVGDVPAVLAQMRGDPVRARRLGQLRRPERLGIRPAPRVAHGRHVVDVDPEPQGLARRAARHVPASLSVGTLASGL